MVIRVPRMRRGPPSTHFTTSANNLPVYQPCLAPTSVMLRLSNSCRVVLPGRRLVPGIITSSLVLGLIVQLPTLRILRCVEVSCLCGRLITLTIDRFDDDPRVHLPWLGEWFPGGQMEERSIGELPQHGRPLGFYDPGRGTVSNVGSGRVKRSSPLAAAKGLELNGNGF